MKYAITKEQRFFFDTHLFIEFEELLSKSDRELLLRGVEKEFGAPIDTIAQEEIFLRGRDIAMRQSGLRKALFTPGLGQIAQELTGQKRLRFGFDQLYSTLLTKPDLTIFSQLEEESCIRGLACAIMICLKGEAQEENKADQGIDPFPSKPGSGIFFLPSVVCNPHALQAHPNQLFLLLAWAKSKAQYVFAPRDPHTHDLKKLGFVFGDSLTEKYHPTWK
ncbi:MAG: hypothetical protein JSR46_11065 [Verrucomicrobia bacterium]|nr:hypothetical protein [Verrucomicrobiota bacterium]